MTSIYNNTSRDPLDLTPHHKSPFSHYLSFCVHPTDDSEVDPIETKNSAVTVESNLTETSDDDSEKEVSHTEPTAEDTMDAQSYQEDFEVDDTDGQSVPPSPQRENIAPADMSSADVPIPDTVQETETSENCAKQSAKKQGAASQRVETAVWLSTAVVTFTALQMAKWL